MRVRFPSDPRFPDKGAKSTNLGAIVTPSRHDRVMARRGSLWPGLLIGRSVGGVPGVACGDVEGVQAVADGRVAIVLSSTLDRAERTPTFAHEFVNSQRGGGCADVLPGCVGTLCWPERSELIVDR